MLFKILLLEERKKKEYKKNLIKMINIYKIKNHKELRNQKYLYNIKEMSKNL